MTEKPDMINMGGETINTIFIAWSMSHGTDAAKLGLVEAFQETNALQRKHRNAIGYDPIDPLKTDI